MSLNRNPKAPNLLCACVICIIGLLTFSANSHAAPEDYIERYTRRTEYKTLEIGDKLVPHHMVIPSLHYENKFGGTVQDDLKNYDERVEAYSRSFATYALNNNVKSDVDFLANVKTTLDSVGAATDVTEKMVNTLGIVARGADLATQSKILNTLKATYHFEIVGEIGGHAEVVGDLVDIADKVVLFADVMLEAKKASDRSRDQEITQLETIQQRMLESGVSDTAALDGIEAALKKLQEDKGYADAVVNELQERKHELAGEIMKSGVDVKIGAMASANISAYIVGTASVSTLGAGFLISGAAMIAKDGISSWAAGGRFKELEKQASCLANLDQYLRKSDPTWSASLDQYKLAHAYLSIQLEMAQIHENEMGKIEKWTGSFDPSVIALLEQDLSFLATMIASLESSLPVEGLIALPEASLPENYQPTDPSIGNSGLYSSSSSPNLGDITIDSKVDDVTVINKTRADLEVNIHSIEAHGNAKSGDITLKGRGNNITVIKKSRQSEAEVNVGSVVVGD
ncbi:hypothetical protein [Desulfovibrio sp. Huiquan2017]|uniref:hypothetical protein n=1 Tax=Desulfovibrio sp. Huiquan2017 TaxID=2816861 RepID=UPI001A91688E|nr:hypothetical protein [Desulfovibrio sp. Huiquan2017]